PIYEDGSINCRPTAVAGCRFVSTLATQLSPSFVRDHYEVIVRPVHLLDWDELAPVDIKLRSRETGEVYPLVDVADGLRLWVEIALIEAADAMLRVEVTLRNALDAVVYAAQAEEMTNYLASVASAIERPQDPPFDRTLSSALQLAPGVQHP